VVCEPVDTQQVLAAAVEEMRRLGIGHVTVQIERHQMCDDSHP
jgi:hypothetical protein